MSNIIALSLHNKRFSPADAIHVLAMATTHFGAALERFEGHLLKQMTEEDRLAMVHAWNHLIDQISSATGLDASKIP